MGIVKCPNCRQQMEHISSERVTPEQFRREYRGLSNGRMTVSTTFYCGVCNQHWKLDKMKNFWARVAPPRK